MERFFKISKEDKYYKAEKAYKDSFSKISGVCKQVLDEFEITTTKVITDPDRLWVEPTPDTVDRFGKDFLVEYRSGLSGFKKNTAVNKRYVELLKEQEPLRFRSPHIMMYISDMMGTSAQVQRFFRGEHLFCRVITNSDHKYAVPEYWEEISGSEYHLKKESE